jgi:hypothetical protein
MCWRKRSTEKNTFQSPQMMLWQRGPSNQRSDQDYLKIGRAKTIDSAKMASFHKLDHAPHFKERPSPVFYDDLDMNQDTWFYETEEHMQAKLKDVTWLLA